MILVLALLPAVAVAGLLTKPGGISDTTVSATYEPVVFAVNAIKDQFAKNNGGSTFSEGLELVKVVRARTQVVAGEKLYLTLLLTGDVYCDVTVWYRVWLQGADRMQVTDGPTCEKKQKPAADGSASPPSVGGQLGPGAGLFGGFGRSKPGGISKPQPLPWPGHPVHRALAFATCAVNDRLNSQFAVTLAFHSGITYTQQVTQGMTYRFYNVPLVPTTCRNQGCANLDLSTCNINIFGTQKRMCSFRVQYEAWMVPQYNLTDVTC